MSKYKIAKSRAPLPEIKRTVSLLASPAGLKQIEDIDTFNDGVTTCVLIGLRIGGRMWYQVGVAECGPNDTFSEEIGFTVARGRAVRQLAERMLDCYRNYDNIVATLSATQRPARMSSGIKPENIYAGRESAPQTIVTEDVL